MNKIRIDGDRVDMVAKLTVKLMSEGAAFSVRLVVEHGYDVWLFEVTGY
ncbi:MAG: hypothetical protein GY759_09105 [Chloroflexi bacterium]|nr:hypothetical protein [Chloroflexota bacterium]